MTGRWTKKIRMGGKKRDETEKNGNERYQSEGKEEVTGVWTGLADGPRGQPIIITPVFP